MLSNIVVLIVSIIVVAFWVSSSYLIFFGESEKAMKVYGVTAIILIFIISGILIYVLGIK